MQWTEPAGKLLVVREPARRRLGHDRHYVMPHDDRWFRIKVRAEMCLRPGWLHVAPLLTPPPPGIVRFGPDGVPAEIPIELLPPDLREIGAIFWMVFDSDREPVGFERV